MAQAELITSTTSTRRPLGRLRPCPIMGRLMGVMGEDTVDLRTEGKMAITEGGQGGEEARARRRESIRHGRICCTLGGQGWFAVTRGI